MEGIRIQLLGISIILAGIAIGTNNFAGFIGGALGLAIAVGGSFWKDSQK